METTLIILKPDAVQRGLVGELLQRFERKGLRLVGMKLMTVPRELAEKHYAEHAGKGFYPGLIAFVTSSPVVVLAIRGIEAIAVCRNLIGSTNGRKAAPGTIRGDFGLSGGYNLVHGSDSPESATRELSLWFTPAELNDYTPSREAWVYDPSDLK
mgnify:CR=1 FL=1